MPVQEMPEQLLLVHHPPDFGMLCKRDGKKAKKLKGNAKAMAKPSIPIAGPRYEPDVETSTSSVPMIGPVHENETKTNVKAINRMLIIPLVESALASILFTQDEGSVISNTPKNEMANTTNSAKKRRLNTALVASC